MKEVKIKIKMEQQNNLGDKDSVEFITYAKLYIKDEGIYLVYDESEITGMDNTTTTIKIYSKHVSIKRYGNMKSLMIFEENKQHKSKYQTPQGLFIIDIITNKLDIEYKDENNLEMHIDYNLRLDGLFEGNNKLYLKIV